MERQKIAAVSTIRRLPSYLHFLKQLDTNGRTFVSSTHIADELGLQPDQVRKDLSVTGIIGRPKAGFHVPGLIKAIQDFLGWDNATDAFLVGAGNLGSALLGYKGFEQHGLRIVAAFDADPDKVGSVIHGIQVLPLDKLQDLAVRMRIHMGVITVPAQQAQTVADTMIGAGIIAIWNFAPVCLDVPTGISIQNEDLSSGLAVLSVRLSKSLRPEPDPESEE